MFLPLPPNDQASSLAVTIRQASPLYHSPAEVIVADAITILSQLIAFDTTSSRSNLPLIQFVEEYLDNHGIPSRRIPSGDGLKANLLATIGPRGDGGIVLSGHTDVVPVADQLWETPPFELTERDGKLFGRGSSDMKAFLALTMAAVPLLARQPLSRPVHLAFSYDEEVGCLGAPDLIRELLDEGHLPSAAIVGEPTEMGIVNSHKGLTIYEVVVTGREAHSSLVHEGTSSIMVAIDILTALRGIAEHERLHHCDPSFDPPWSTLTVGTIHGGTAPNILARECRFTFDLRTTPTRDVGAVLKPFWTAVAAARRQLQAEDPDADISVRRLASVPGLARESGSAAEQIATKLTGANGQPRAVSYGAEAGQFQAAGISTVICGPGSISQAHRPNEFIEISQIQSGAQFMLRLVELVREAE